MAKCSKQGSTLKGPLSGFSQEWLRSIAGIHSEANGFRDAQNYLKMSLGRYAHHRLNKYTYTQMYTDDFVVNAAYINSLKRDICPILSI